MFGAVGMTLSVLPDFLSPLRTLRTLPTRGELDPVG